ncbi:hypothetical protein SPHINGOAX6_70569 [Sphingomonas sp. AX6]|nr:hypothetical protein SPHINGOAX6_70569 [Sphingomonas sp. AX6]
MATSTILLLFRPGSSRLISFRCIARTSFGCGVEAMQAMCRPSFTAVRLAAVSILMILTVVAVMAGWA